MHSTERWGQLEKQDFPYSHSPTVRDLKVLCKNNKFCLICLIYYSCSVLEFDIRKNVGGQATGAVGTQDKELWRRIQCRGEHPLGVSYKQKQYALFACSATKTGTLFILFIYFAFSSVKPNWVPLSKCVS